MAAAGQAQGLSALSQLEFKGSNPITGRSQMSSNREEDSPTKNDSPQKARESLKNNFGLQRDPTSISRNMNIESKPSLITDRSQKDLSQSPMPQSKGYTPMPPSENFDYNNPAYVKRYMQEGAQKKTGFR